MTLVLLFWCSALLLFHNFFGFQLTMRFFALFLKKKPTLPTDFCPSLTVFIPAHNEENDIAAKLESVLNQGYPAEKLEILVASDVSTDRTNEIVRGYQSRGVTLIDFRERHGKLGALDELIPQAKGEIVVITDANVLLGEGALKRLAAAYADPKVGAASGYQTVELPNKATKLREEVAYRSFEANQKIILSRFGLLVGAFGGFYSVRKSCFRPIGLVGMNDDIVIPLEVLAQGYKTVFVPKAIGYEAIGETMDEEYRRRIRMTAYNLNALTRAIRCGMTAGLLALYVIISYKILRWLAPFIWLILAISSAMLASQGGIYLITAGIFACGLGAALIGWLAARSGKRLSPFTQTYYFTKMNFATAPGLILWLRGVNRYWGHRAA